MKIRMSEDYVYDSNEDADHDGPVLIKRYACRDRMCGAGDCPTCHPEVSKFYNPEEENEDD